MAFGHRGVTRRLVLRKHLGVRFDLLRYIKFQILEQHRVIHHAQAQRMLACREIPLQRVRIHTLGIIDVRRAPAVHLLDIGFHLVSEVIRQRLAHVLPFPLELQVSRFLKRRFPVQSERTHDVGRGRARRHIARPQRIQSRFLHREGEFQIAVLLFPAQDIIPSFRALRCDRLFIAGKTVGINPDDSAAGSIPFFGVFPLDRLIVLLAVIAGFHHRARAALLLEALMQRLAHRKRRQRRERRQHRGGADQRKQRFGRFAEFHRKSSPISL